MKKSTNLFKTLNAKQLKVVVGGTGVVVNGDGSPPKP